MKETRIMMPNKSIMIIFKPAFTNAILTQTQSILQEIFKNFVIFFTLHSFPSNQIRGQLLLNYQC